MHFHIKAFETFSRTTSCTSFAKMTLAKTLFVVSLLMSVVFYGGTADVGKVDIKRCNLTMTFDRLGSMSATHGYTNVMIKMPIFPLLQHLILLRTMLSILVRKCSGNIENEITHYALPPEETLSYSTKMQVANYLQSII